MTVLGSIDDLLARHGLAGVREEPFPNDGWSGAALTLLRRDDGARFVLKRDSLATDWIARATRDGPLLREAWFAADGPALPDGIRSGSLGGGRDDSTAEVGILMPDLSGVLFDWDAPIAVDDLDRVLAALAAMHAHPWHSSAGAPVDGPWCPLAERVTLICRASLERPGPARDAVADRLLPGWDAWDRLATRPARDLVAGLAAEPRRLLRALARQPSTLIHGDLKLANAGIEADGVVVLVDWQMVSVAPVAVELGWFLVSNVASLPVPPDAVLQRYWAMRGIPAGDENHLAILVGLLLRGWRKGMDAAAGITLASGVAAADDLAWWCERAVVAADRVL
jgi:hypothetical protein